MDDLGRYVAGPVAVASLAAALRDVNVFVTGALGALAVVWAVAGFLAWKRDRLTVKHRAIRLANRIRRCVPKWWTLPDFSEQSAYGNEASAARFLTMMARRSRQLRSKVPRIKRRYTDGFHWRKVEPTIAALARAGAKDNHLEQYVSRVPQPSEYDDLARNLWWTASRLP